MSSEPLESKHSTQSPISSSLLLNKRNTWNTSQTGTLELMSLQETHRVGGSDKIRSHKVLKNSRLSAQ